MTLPYPAGHPSQYPFGHIKHYYGDAVRIIFVALAVMTGVSIPMSGQIRAGIIIGVPAIILLLVLAGLTSPHGRSILVLNTVVSGAGILLTQAVALSAYSYERYALFLFVEFMSALLMAALYFSVKTVRAMATHRIGRPDEVGEFDQDPSPVRPTEFD